MSFPKSVLEKKFSSSSPRAFVEYCYRIFVSFILSRIFSCSGYLFIIIICILWALWREPFGGVKGWNLRAELESAHKEQGQTGRRIKTQWMQDGMAKEANNHRMLCLFENGDTH